MFLRFTTILIFISVVCYSLFLKNENPEKDINSDPAGDWFERQRAYPFEEIPIKEYISSVEFVKNKIHTGSSSRMLDWSLTGPVNVEGRITSIAFHRTNPFIVYIGTAAGGVWRTTDFCQSWTSIFDNQNTSSIGVITMDPQVPGVIYCGTGESNASRATYPGTGIYKSTNDGQSWSFSGLDSSYGIGNIVINPVNNLEIYAAATGSLRTKNMQRGIYKSVNGGISWSRSLFLSDSVGAIDVAIDRSNPSRIFAAMWERSRRENYIKYGGQYSGLYLSVNSGVSWSQVSGGFPVNDPLLGRISIDIPASNNQIVYALTAYANGSSRALFKSTNGGIQWSQINTSVAASSNYAWYNRICRVKPDDPNLLFCGGLNMERSTNGGTSFASVSASHVDQHTVAFSQFNPNYMVIGNDGGIDFSTDAGLTWQASHSLPITQFYDGEINQNNQNDILGGTQDNGTPRTSGALNSWFDIYGGDGFYCLIDYLNPQNVYASSQNGVLGRSTNGGASFLSGTTGLDLAYTNWNTPFVFDKTNPQILYCGTYKVHKSVNGMQSWTPISPDLANAHIVNQGTITTLDVSRSDPNVIYAGTDDANVWVTTNGGNNWTKINTGLPNRWVTRLTVHPDSANICYVSLSGYKVDTTGAHIFRTTNFGNSWISVRGNLPDAPVNDIVLDPLNSSILYIATDINVLYSTNIGASWSILGNGLPSNIPCHDLTIHKNSRTMVVWTHGRSSFRIQLPPVTGVTNNGSSIPGKYSLEQNYPNPFNPSTLISYNISSSGSVRLIVYDITGKLVKELVNEKKIACSYNVKFNSPESPSGIYFYKFSFNGFSSVKKMIYLK